MAELKKRIQKNYYVLDTTKGKIKYLWPGEKPPQDSEDLVVHTGSVTLLGIVYFVFFTSFFLGIGFVAIKPNMMGQDFFYHCGRFWLLILSKLSSLFEWGVTKQYLSQITNLSDKDGWKLLWSWIFGLVPGIATTGYLTYKSIYPVGGIKQVRGKVVLEGQKAYDHLQAEFERQCRPDKSGRSNKSNLIVGTNFFYDPQINYTTPFPKKSTIPLPEDMRRTHDIFIGGTGRGKTQLVYTLRFAQIYRQIRNGDLVKLFIVDTPKSDYSKHLYVKDFYNIAPHEKNSVIWDISKDLWDELIAQAFWKGRVPPNEKDPTWTDTAVLMGTGCTKFLQQVAPKAWNFGMLAYMMGKLPEELKLIVTPHYPQIIQVVRAAKETISSVMFQMASKTSDLVSLASIYDCFESKSIIHQATVKALKMNTFIEFHARSMSHYYSPTEGLSSIEQRMRDEERVSAYCFHALVQKLNQEKPDWNWRYFANTLNDMNLNEIIKLAIDIKANQPDLFGFHLSSESGMNPIEDMKIKSGHFCKLATTIMTYAKEWDKAEAVERLSIGDWLVDENPNKKILVLKPSETYPTLTEGLIKGILYYTNSVMLGRVSDDKNRKAHIIIDELSSFGNIKEFIQPALALYRSKGWSISLAFQDLAQLVEIYQENFVKFLNSNIANFYILGVNDGETANQLSDLLGKKAFKKKHINRSTSKDGTSQSEDWQEHETEVMRGNEFNLLGAKVSDSTILYLYIGKGMNTAYLLTADIIDYKTRNKMTPADWTTKGNLKLPFVKNKYRPGSLTKNEDEVNHVQELLGDEDFVEIDYTDIDQIMDKAQHNPSELNKYLTNQKMIHKAKPEVVIKPISEISLEEQDDVSDMVAKEVAVNALGGDALTIAKGLIESLQSKERPIDANTNTMR